MKMKVGELQGQLEYQRQNTVHIVGMILVMILTRITYFLLQKEVFPKKRIWFMYAMSVISKKVT